MDNREFLFLFLIPLFFAVILTVFFSDAVAEENLLIFFRK